MYEGVLGESSANTRYVVRVGCEKRGLSYPSVRKIYGVVGLFDTKTMYLVWVGHEGNEEKGVSPVHETCVRVFCSRFWCR